MALDADISREFAEVVAQTDSATIALAAIAVEIRSVPVGERRAPELSAAVLMAHARRAALAVSSLAALAGRLDMPVRLGAV